MISSRQRSYLKLAKRVAKRSDCRCQIGSVLVKSGRVISFGWNSRKRTPKSAKLGYNWSLHAEIDTCLGFSPEEIRDATLYNYREDRQGRRKISKPCPTCEHVLRGLGVRRVYYSTTEGTQCLSL